MTGYGQFCAVARAHEALGGRWTLLVVRELLCGSRRFNDIRRGIPRISRTMLAERLRDLVRLGAAIREEGPQGPEYRLTEAGGELAGLIGAFAAWGQRWLPRRAAEEDVESGPLLVDMQRRVRLSALPKEPLVVRVEIAGEVARFLLLKASESAFCLANPGFPEPLRLRAPLPALVAWWRGDASFAEAGRAGLRLDGPRALVRAFPGWFDRYAFAGIVPAQPPGPAAGPAP
ncbi:MAG: helix-turn-helix domain-containing protein [Thalassobaculales bacterium]